MAGVVTALNDIDWQTFGGRYIVFITDASAREGHSPLAATRLSTEQVRTLAQERGVALYAVHLKTPEGRKDHAAAENPSVTDVQAQCGDHATLDCCGHRVKPHAACSSRDG